METRSVQTAIVVLAFLGIAAELRAQTAAPVNIPLEYRPDATKLAINIGINGGAPKPYVFDTGSPVFNAVYNPTWWPGVPASSSLLTNAQFCLGNSSSTFCRGYPGNLVQVPSLAFYQTTSAQTPAATLAASPGYVVNAAYVYGVSPGFYALPPFTSPPLDGYFYGTFGAGDFATNVTTNTNPSLEPQYRVKSGYFAGGVLGQTLVSGVTQGYVVAANGQRNLVSSTNPPQQVNGIKVSIGGQTLQPVTSCSPA